jgi:hypothetical protein
MNRLFIILLLCITVCFSNSTFSETKQPHTVLDYYQLLPERYFESPDVRTKWIQHSSSIIDLANGYLFLHGDGAQPNLIVCLFKTTDKTYLIGVHADGSDDNELNFYRYSHEQWKDVTEQVLPSKINHKFLHEFARYNATDSNYEYTIEMPRNGTTIVIKNSQNKKVYDLIWTKKVFKLKKY